MWTASVSKSKGIKDTKESNLLSQKDKVLFFVFV